jgi:hypothetical protein
MHTIQNTLYVMTPQAYAHLENATVRIDVEREKKLQVASTTTTRSGCIRRSSKEGS